MTSTPTRARPATWRWTIRTWWPGSRPWPNSRCRWRCCWICTCPRTRPTGDRGLPVLLWIHGGGWKHGTKERCQLAWPAAEGWAVAGIDSRLSWQACMPARLDDCRAAIAWLRREAATYGLDPDRLFVGGSSAGGHLAALIGTAGTGAAPVRG